MTPRQESIPHSLCDTGQIFFLVRAARIQRRVRDNQPCSPLRDARHVSAVLPSVLRSLASIYRIGQIQAGGNR